MFRNVARTSFIVNLLGTADTVNDNVNKATETEKKVDLSVLQNETGLDRLKRMFEVDEFGALSKEVTTILNVGAMSLFVGAMYGGVINSRDAYVNFMKNNQATMFHDHLEAKKRLQDAVTKSFGKGAWKWSWRLTLFTTTFVGISTTISVYRGKSGILEYVAGGLISGSLYKFNMGPRGWIVGGGLGSVLGLMAGVVTLGILEVTGMSMEEVRYWQYYWRQERSEYIRKGMRDYKEKEESDAYKHHQKVVEGLENTLDKV